MRGINRIWRSQKLGMTSAHRKDMRQSIRSFHVSPSPEGACGLLKIGSPKVPMGFSGQGCWSFKLIGTLLPRILLRCTVNLISIWFVTLDHLSWKLYNVSEIVVSLDSTYSYSLWVLRVVIGGCKIEIWGRICKYCYSKSPPPSPQKDKLTYEQTNKTKKLAMQDFG